MKKKMFFAVCAVVFSTMLSAQTFTFGNVYYEVLSVIPKATVAVAINPSRYWGNVTIPDSVTYNEVQYSVVKINDRAFNGCVQLFGVTLPATLTTIGVSAFEGCLQLGSVVLPSGVTEVGERAFRNCSRLQQVLLPDSLTEVSVQMFQNCTMLQNIVLPDKMRALKYWAFDHCTSMQGVSMNEGLERIENDAFAFCSQLDTVIFPNSVTYVGAYAFQNNVDLDTVVFGQGIDSIEMGCFSNCEELGDVSIPASVDFISMNAFEMCFDMQNILVEPTNAVYQSEQGLLYSKDGAILYMCPTGRKDTVVVLNSVTNIAPYAFNQCAEIEYVQVGSAVLQMGEYVFADCVSLKRFLIETIEPPIIYATTFLNVDKSIPLFVPDVSIADYRAADYWSYFSDIRELTQSPLDELEQVSCVVFPNPVSECLFIRLDVVPQPGLLVVSDAQGRMVYRTQVAKSELQRLLELDVSTWPEGYYVARICGVLSSFVVNR